MYLTLLHRLRVPVIVRQVKTGRGEEERKSEMAGLWSGNGHRQQRSAAFLWFFVFVSINVRVLKSVQDRRGGQATGRAPYKRE